MITPLSKGQNLPVPAGTVLQAHIGPSGAHALWLVSLDAADRVRRVTPLAAGNQPAEPGVAIPVPDQVVLALAHLDPAVERWWLILAGAHDGPVVTPGRDPRMVLEADSVPFAVFECHDLTTETAVVAVEVYRRADALKVRAVGQGRDDGLAGLLAPHGGLPAGTPEHPHGQRPSTQPASTHQPARRYPGTAAPSSPSGEPPAAAPAPPPGTGDAERALAVTRQIFEDMARSTAGYRSSIAYAKERHEQELAAMVADPTLRNSVADRQQIDQRYDDLVLRAGTTHHRDMAQLGREIAALESALPAQLADWPAAAWNRPVAGVPGGGIRIGTVSGELSPELAVPWALPVPLPRPLWVAGRGPESVAAATAIITRLLATQPAGAWRIRLVDIDGELARVFTEPALRSLLDGPPAMQPGDLPQVLAELAARADLLHMARGAGAVTDLPPEVHAGPLLLVLSGTGPVSEEDVRRIRALQHTTMNEVLLVGDMAEAAQALQAMPISVDQQNTLRDSWTGQDWRVTVDRGPAAPVRWQDLAHRSC